MEWNKTIKNKYYFHILIWWKIKHFMCLSIIYATIYMKNDTKY